MRFKFSGLCLVILLFLGCSSTVPKNPYVDAFAAENIRSILIVPAVNHSIDIDAPWVMLTTLPELLAEMGYYVFPVNTVKVVLEHEGLYEAAEAHALKPSELAGMFEADSVLYITINHWRSKYILVNTETEVSLSYRLVSRNGTELWRAEKSITKTSSTDQQGGLLEQIITNAVNAAIQKAKPNYRPLAQELNQAVFVTESTQLPDGPYLIEAQAEK